MSERSLEQLLATLELTAGRFARLEPAMDWQPLEAGRWPSMLVAVVEGSLGLDCQFTGLHAIPAGTLLALRCSRAMVRNASRIDEPPARIVFGGVAPLLADGNPWLDADGALMHTRIAGSDLLRTVQGELVQESTANAPGAGAIVDCIAKRMFTMVMRDQIAWVTGDGRTARLVRSVAHLRTHLGQPHTVDGLAAIAGMSRSAYTQAFSLRYGTSPMDYLTRLRIQRARVLLRNTDRPIKAIGLDLGYRSRTSFWSAFKRHAGMDPSAFRMSGGTNTRAEESHLDL